MNAIDHKERLLLVSTDDRLEHLLRAEAHELCISMRTERSASVLDALPATVRLILWDMDTVALPPLSPPPECPVFGLTRRTPPTTTPPPLTRVWHRPFSVDALRSELVRIICAERTPLTAAHDSRIPIRISEKDAALHIGENRFALTENEAAIMSLLLQHRGQTVTKEQLRQAIANASTIDSDTTSNKVEVYLCRLRAKLELPLGRRLFTTVRGVGYRLDLGDEYTN